MNDLFATIHIPPRKRPARGGATGKAARGYNDATCGSYLKVSIGWHRGMFEAVNRRVVRNKSTFGREVRRLVEMALKMDHMDQS